MQQSVQRWSWRDGRQINHGAPRAAPKRVVSGDAVERRASGSGCCGAIPSRRQRPKGMTYDFTVYRLDGLETLGFTVEADDEDAARRELAQRLAGVGITAEELGDWKIGVTVVRQGRERSEHEDHP